MITGEYTNAQYHALPSLSKSGLDRIALSPAHFQAGFQGIGADTARIGTAVHASILEGDKGLIVPPLKGRSSGLDRLWWNVWFEEHGAYIDTDNKTGLKAAEWFPEFEKQTGLTIATEPEMTKIRLMKQSVMESSMGLLEEGVAEQSILFEYNGVSCRVRPDWLRPDHIMVDVKSARDASPRGFARACANHRYHVQAAFYSVGYHAVTGHWPEFYFAPVEKTAPYLSALYKLDDKAMEHGIYLMDRDIETFKECTESGVWPGYTSNLALSIPIWDRDDGEVIDNYEELMA